MNKYQVMYTGAIALLVAGGTAFVWGVFFERVVLYFGICMLLMGLWLFGYWLSKAYVYICRECYLRIGVGVKGALFALPAEGGLSRRIYCPKCRRKTICRSRRVSLRVNIY